MAGRECAPGRRRRPSYLGEAATHEQEVAYVVNAGDHLIRSSPGAGVDASDAGVVGSPQWSSPAG
jgi:hypothetical protein